MGEKPGSVADALDDWCALRGGSALSFSMLVKRVRDLEGRIADRDSVMRTNYDAEARAATAERERDALQAEIDRMRAGEAIESDGLTKPVPLGQRHQQLLVLWTAGNAATGDV